MVARSCWYGCFFFFLCAEERTAGTIWLIKNTLPAVILMVIACYIPTWTVIKFFFGVNNNLKKKKKKTWALLEVQLHVKNAVVKKVVWLAFKRGPWRLNLLFICPSIPPGSFHPPQRDSFGLISRLAQLHRAIRLASAAFKCCVRTQPNMSGRC